MPAPPSHPEAARGAIAAAAGFLCWGIVPVYWKQLAAVPPLELIAHRIVWSLLFLLVVQAWRGRFGAVREGFADARLPAFALIWAGLFIYTGDGFWSQRRRLFG